MRTLSCLVLICTLAAAKEDRPSLRFGPIRVEGSRVVGTILAEGESTGRTATVSITTSEGLAEHTVELAGRETLFVFDAGGEPSSVALGDGKPLRIREVHRQPPDALIGHLLFLTDSAYKGRVAGSMESFNLANELRGMLFKAGTKPIAWPTVPIPQPRIHGTRELTLLKGDEVVARLNDSYLPFYLSARPKMATVFKSVVSHPAESVKDAFVLLPEPADVELARKYAERGAAAVGVVTKEWARVADWTGSFETTPGDVLRAGGPAIPIPYVSLSPEAAQGLSKHAGKGVLKFRASIETRTTSNIVGLLGNPREHGLLLTAPWDGRGAKDALRDATAAAVVLWVAEQLKRDFDRGALKRPVVLALLGGQQVGNCGEFQLDMVLESPQTPIARPSRRFDVSDLSRGTINVAWDKDESRAVLVAALEAEGLTVMSRRMSGPSKTCLGSGDDHEPVDLESVRKTARALYRTVRKLASN